MEKNQIETLAKELETNGEVVFVYNKNVYAIWEYEQGEDWIKYKINVYEEEEYRESKESGEEPIEHNSGIYVGTALHTIAFVTSKQEKI